MDELDEWLIGKELKDGWVIQEPRLVQRDGFSACRTYVGRNATGQVAFVKLLDPRANGSLEEAQLQMTQFIYEKGVVDVCATRNMRRVIRGLGNGELQTPAPFSLTLHYLIFEWAECDVRSPLDLDERRHFAAILRWLHHVATGLQELHFSKIAHQDVKPANVLVMPDQTAKLGDLGRAHRHDSPRLGLSDERDPSYTAPELLYGGAIESFDQRCAADMYAFGSLVYFLMVGMSLNADLARALPNMHHWSQWRGTFDDVLLYVRRAFEDVIVRATPQLDAGYAERLGIALRQLCDPDPRYRGHPSNRDGQGPRYGFERFVSLFNVLAEHAQTIRPRAV